MGINKNCHFIQDDRSSISQVKQRKTIYTKTNDYDRSLYSESSCVGSLIHKQMPLKPTNKDDYSKLNVVYEGEMMKTKKSKTILLPKKFGHFSKLKKRNKDFDKYMEHRKSQSLDSTVQELKTRIDNLNELISAKIPTLTNSLKFSPIKIYSSHEFNVKKEEPVDETKPKIENVCMINKMGIRDSYLIHFFLAIFIITTISLTFIVFNEQTEIFSNFFNPNKISKNSKKGFSLFRQTYIKPDKNLWDKIVEMTKKITNIF